MGNLINTPREGAHASQGSGESRVNEFGQPIGPAVAGWSPIVLPAAVSLPGRCCTLEPLDVERHVDDLYDAYALAPDARDWTYLPIGPFLTRGDYREWASHVAAGIDQHYAVIDHRTARAVGTIALMRSDSANGAIEVGAVIFSPAMQRTVCSTEAQYLLMRHVFDLGFRRYEWKCDSLNRPSRLAAQRLGFTYEGTFRQLIVYKGRSRYTAWFSITDFEWPRVGDAFEKWLDPANFTANGQQISALRAHLGGND